MYKPIRKADLIIGGTTIKQGEIFTLGFQLFGADGLVIVPTVGQTITVKVANKTGVVFETTAVVVDDHIEFTVDENIGSGKMRVELTVADGVNVLQKYPANGYIELNITSSLDDIGVGFIYTVTAAEMFTRIEGSEIASADAVQTAGEAVVIAGNAVVTADAVRADFDLVVAEAGSSNPEVVLARGGEADLSTRLNGVDSQLADTAEDLESRSINILNMPRIIPEADDSGRFQRAIDKLPTGGNILVSGDYTIGGIIINTENINIFGRSKNDKLIIKNGTTGILVKQNKVSFANLTVLSQGTKTDGLNTNGILYEKTPANSIGFTSVKNVDFKLFSGYGIKVVNAIQFTYDFGYILGCNKGIVFDCDAGGLSFGTTVIVRLVYLSNCTRGIDAFRLHRTLFEEVVAEYCDYGIYASICSITLLRGYFEKNYIRGAYIVDSEFQDLYNYENNTTTDAIFVTFTSAVLPSDRGYVRGNKSAYTTKTIGILSNYGVDPKYFSAYGNTNNIGLKYAENIVPLVRGDNLATPSAWTSNRISEFQGFDQSKQGYKVQGVTAGDNSYGIKQDVTLDNTKQHIIDIVSTTVSGSGIATIRCGTLTVTNGVPFTPPVNGLQTIKAFGIDVAGTPFECYVNVFNLSEVKTQEKYTAIAQDKLSANKAGRGVVYLIAAPTAGTWGIGEKVYNSTPTAGGYEGWICVATGTPGTWKGFGLIQT